MRTEYVKISDKAKMELVKEIRMQVFIQEQNVPYEEDWDGLDSENYLIYSSEDIAVGTMRWRETDKEIKIERVAVLKSYRNKGYGTVIMEHVLKDLKLLKTNKEIILHSQLQAIPLYKRLGFVKYGEIFYEAQIPHYAMRLLY